MYDDRLDRAVLFCWSRVVSTLLFLHDLREVRLRPTLTYKSMLNRLDISFLAGLDRIYQLGIKEGFEHGHVIFGLF